MNEENNSKKINKDKNSVKSRASFINKDNKTVLIIIAVVLLLAIGGIGSQIRNKTSTTLSNKAIESTINSFSDSKIKINNQDNSYTISDGNGNSATSNNTGALSADFPSDIPLYTNQEIIGNTRTKTTSGVGWIVSADSNDSAETVNSFFKDKLATAGWTNVNEFSINNTFSAEYRKGNVSFSYVIAPGTSNKPSTGITYSVTQK